MVQGSPIRIGCGSCGSAGASGRLQIRSCGHGMRGGGRRRSIGPARWCRNRRTRLARKCRWLRRQGMHARSCSRCSRRGEARRAKRLRRARDLCLLAVARAVACLVAVPAAHRGTIEHDVVGRLTIVAQPYLPEGGTFQAEMTNLRTGRAGPERRRGRAPWTLSCSMPLYMTRSAGGGGRQEK